MKNLTAVLSTPSENGAPLGKSVLELSIRHPVRGDVQLRLGYDTDDDGIVNVQAPVEIHLAREGSRGS